MADVIVYELEFIPPDVSGAIAEFQTLDAVLQELQASAIDFGAALQLAGGVAEEALGEVSGASAAAGASLTETASASELAAAALAEEAAAGGMAAEAVGTLAGETTAAAASSAELAGAASLAASAEEAEAAAANTSATAHERAAISNKKSADSLALMGAAFLAVEAISVKLSADVESNMAKIEGLTGATHQEVVGLTGDILELGDVVGKTGKELSEGLYYVSSSGFKGAEALEVLTASARGSAAGLGETQTTADFATTALNAYGLGANRAAQSIDILTAAVAAGKAEPEEFASSIGRVLPVAAQLHVSLEQVTASMATMTLAGLSADESSTALRGTLNALIAPSQESIQTLARLGLTTEDLRRSIAEKGLLNTLQMLMDKTGGNIQVLSDLIPNVRALTGVLATSGTQAETYAQILDQVTNSAGATDKAFQVASQTMSFEASRLRADLEKALGDIGRVLIPTLTPAFHDLAGGIKAASDSAQPLAEQFNKLPPPLRDVLVLAPPTAASLLLVAAGTAKVIDTMKDGKAAVVELGGALRSLGASSVGLLANPATWVIAAGAVLVAAAAYVTLKNNAEQAARAQQDLEARSSTIRTAMQALAAETGNSEVPLQALIRRYQELGTEKERLQARMATESSRLDEHTAQYYREGQAVAQIQAEQKALGVVIEEITSKEQQAAEFNRLRTQAIGEEASAHLSLMQAANLTKDAIMEDQRVSQAWLDVLKDSRSTIHEITMALENMASRPTQEMVALKLQIDQQKLAMAQYRDELVNLESPEERHLANLSREYGEMINSGASVEQLSRKILEMRDTYRFLSPAQIEAAQTLGGVMAATEAGIAKDEAAMQVLRDKKTVLQDTIEDHKKLGFTEQELADATQLWADRTGKATEEVATVTAEKLGEAADEADTAAQSIEEKVLDHFAQIPTQASTTLETLRSKVLSDLDALSGPATTSAEAVGTNIGSGLQSGMAGQEQAVYQSGVSLGRAATRGVADGAETHSASEATKRTARDVGAGYVEGMSREEAAMAMASAKAGKESTRAFHAEVTAANKAARAEHKLEAELAAHDMLAGYAEGFNGARANMQALFGKEGVGLAVALNMAMIEGTRQSASAVSREVESVIIRAYEANVPLWREKGDALAAVFYQAVAARGTSGEAAAVANAQAVMAALNREIAESQFWQAWDRKSRDAAAKVNENLETAATKITVAYQKMDTDVEAAIQRLADSRALAAAQQKVNELITAASSGVNDRNLGIQRTRSSADVIQGRDEQTGDIETSREREIADLQTGRERQVADLKESHEARLAEIRRTNTGKALSDAITAENRQYQAAQERLQKQWAREDEDRTKKWEREDADRSKAWGREDQRRTVDLARQDDDRTRAAQDATALAQLKEDYESELGISRAQLEDKALAKELDGIKTRTKQEIDSTNEWLTTTNQKITTDLDQFFVDEGVKLGLWKAASIDPLFDGASLASSGILDAWGTMDWAGQQVAISALFGVASTDSDHILSDWQQIAALAGQAAGSAASAPGSSGSGSGGGTHPADKPPPPPPPPPQNWVPSHGGPDDVTANPGGGGGTAAMPLVALDPGALAAIGSAVAAAMADNPPTFVGTSTLDGKVVAEHIYEGQRLGNYA